MQHIDPPRRSRWFRRLAAPLSGLALLGVGFAAQAHDFHHDDHRHHDRVPVHRHLPIRHHESHDHRYRWHDAHRERWQHDHWRHHDRRYARHDGHHDHGLFGRW